MADMQFNTETMQASDWEQVGSIISKALRPEMRLSRPMLRIGMPGMRPTSLSADSSLALIIRSSDGRRLARCLAARSTLVWPR
jgi:hypothetical protein